MTVQVEPEGQTAEPGLEKEYSQQSLEYHLLREERHYIGEGACEIVGVHSEELSSESTAEGVEHAHIAVDSVAKSLIEADVLTVQIEYEYRTLSDRMNAHRGIYQVHYDYGNNEGEAEIAVFAEKLSEPLLSLGLVPEQGSRDGCN